MEQHASLSESNLLNYYQKVQSRCNYVGTIKLNNYTFAGNEH